MSALERMLGWIWRRFMAWGSKEQKPEPVAWWHPKRKFFWAASDAEVPPSALPLYAALAEPEPDAIAAKYNELLMAVWHKYPGETRHETALRYITQAEWQSATADQAKEVKP